MVNEKFRRGTATPRRSRMSYYTRRRHHRLGATSSGTGFKIISPRFMRRVKNRPALRRRSILHAMIRPIIGAMAVAAIVFGTHFGYKQALTSPALSIQSVRLHQVPTMLIEPVRARLKSAYGQNLLAIDLVSLRESIEGLPAVRRAGVRRVLPDGLIVSVEARAPKARVNGDESSFVIDGAAVVLDTFDRRGARLPVIRVVDGGTLVAPAGDYLTQDPVYGQGIIDALAVIDWMADGSGMFPQTVDHLRVEAHGVVMVAGPHEIVLGDAAKLDSKLAAVRSLLRSSPPEAPSSIDVRFADMLVVTALPEETE